MNSLVCLAFVAALAVASAQVLQGPSSGATLRGPDGSVISAAAPGGTVAAGFAPGFAAYAAPAPLVAAPAPLAAAPAPLAYAAPGPLVVAPAGSGLEGQYIPDNLESLYDDGSYKPWVYGF